MLGQLGVAVVFGLTVTVVIAALAPISGAHINPAATFALTLAGKFPRERVLPYVIAQLVGATLAAFLLLALFGMEGNVGVTVPAGSVLQAFVLEAVLTFFLLLVALRSGLPWAVGGTVALEAAMGGPITAASMNPARSFGPALASGPGLPTAVPGSRPCSVPASPWPPITFSALPNPLSRTPSAPRSLLLKANREPGPTRRTVGRVLLGARPNRDPGLRLGAAVQGQTSGS